MTHQKHKYDSTAKFLCDYLPIIVFFICYKFSKAPNPLIIATIYMMVTTLVALALSYFLTKKIAKVALFSGIILGIFGGLTILLKDDIFIKIKPTIINLIFALILFYGYFAKKPFLSSLFGGQVQMRKEAWLVLSMRWGFLFLGLAVLNEIIWRNFSTDFWVQFKVFGMTPISLIFTVMQLPYMMREMKKYNS